MPSHFQDIHITLQPAVYKFISHEMPKEGDALLTSTKTGFGSFLLKKIKRVQYYKVPSEYNCVLRIQSNRILRSAKYNIDVRRYFYTIGQEETHELNVFFQKFMMHYWCFYCYDRLRENPNEKEKNVIQVFMNKYGITEDEIPMHAFHVAYWRFKKSKDSPSKILHIKMHHFL